MAFDWIEDLSTIVDKTGEILRKREEKQNASATAGKKKEMTVAELQAAINAEKAAGGSSTTSVPKANASFEDVLKDFNPDDLEFKKEDDTIPEGTTDSELMKMLYKKMCKVIDKTNSIEMSVDCLIRRVRDLERPSGDASRTSAPPLTGELVDIRSTLSDISNTVNTINNTVDSIERTTDYLYQHCD